MRHSLCRSAFFFLLAVLIPTFGCGGGLTAKQNNASSAQIPAITLSAQPNTVASGASTMLSWKASNASSVTISGFGTFPVSGSLKVAPTTTTTYTATAIGQGGKAQSSATVSVTGASGQKPTISFGAQPASIAAGASTVLNWTAANATSVSIAGVGNYGPSGSVTVSPNATITYTATATGPDGTAASSTTVTVDPTPTISFSAQPDTVDSGQTVTLSWTTTNANSVDIPGLGSFPANGSTQVNPSTSTTYAATAQGTVGTAKASTTVKVNGTSLSHLQASGGWTGWGELPPDYNTCAYPCPGVTWGMTQGIKSPSLSGDATEFNIGGTTPYADVLWNNHLIGQSSSQGLPDSNHTLLPTLHNFTYDAYFYPTNLGVTQALEFDINMYFDGLSLIWGHQCNVLGGNVWDIWDNVNHQWVSTGVACHPKNNEWNHVTIQVQRESDNWLLFQSITLNGVTSTINRYYAPGSVSGSWWGVTVNYQMDGNHDQAGYSAYLDNFTFTYW
jgi:hypothetical protein